MVNKALCNYVRDCVFQKKISVIQGHILEFIVQNSREKKHEIISELKMEDLEERFSLDNQQLLYHIRKLEAAGYLSRRYKFNHGDGTVTIVEGFKEASKMGLRAVKEKFFVVNIPPIPEGVR